MKETLYEGKYLRLVKDGRWEYTERVTGNKVSSIMPVLDGTERKLIFIKEFRYSIQKYVVSFPAGLIGDIDSEESEIESAHRELIEETGYKASSMTKLTVGPSSAGLSDETTYFFMATGLEKVSSGGGDESENISVFVIPETEIKNWISKQERLPNTIVSPRIYVGMYFLNELSK